MNGVRGRAVIVVGDLLYDMVSFVDGTVAPGVDTFTTINASPGGSGANVASWLGRLGVKSHFVGRVGRDVFGEYLEASLSEAEVEAHLGRDGTLATGKVFVMVDGAGERTMITDRGASEAVCPEDLPESIFAHDLHLHLTGYMLSGGTRRETAMLALRLAREAGMSVSVDPSSAPLLEDLGPRRFLDWTKDAHLVFPNLHEGRVLTGVDAPEEVLGSLLEVYPAVVLKLGADGAMYGERGGEISHVAARVIDGDTRLDTTGAGDALCAGFLADSISGVRPEDALWRGVSLAGEVVSASGAGADGGKPGRWDSFRIS